MGSDFLVSGLRVTTWLVLVCSLKKQNNNNKKKLKNPSISWCKKAEGTRQQDSSTWTWDAFKIQTPGTFPCPLTYWKISLNSRRRESAFLTNSKETVKHSWIWKDLVIEPRWIMPNPTWVSGTLSPGSQPCCSHSVPWGSTITPRPWSKGEGREGRAEAGLLTLARKQATGAEIKSQSPSGRGSQTC